MNEELTPESRYVSVELKPEKEISIGQTGFGINLYAGDMQPRNGTFDVYWNDSRITCQSTVVASCCERNAGGGCGIHGDANFQILNVVPQNGRLSWRVSIDWRTPLHYRMHIIVF